MAACPARSWRSSSACWSWGRPHGRRSPTRRPAPDEPIPEPTTTPTLDVAADPTATRPAPTPPPDTRPDRGARADRRPRADECPRGSHADADRHAATRRPDARSRRPTPVLQSRNLYRYSAMVRQYTSYWCVPATVQSMANLVLGTSNRSYSRQGYIYKLTRQHNRYRYATRGNDPQGWGWSLRYFTYGRAVLPAGVYEQGHRRSTRSGCRSPGRVSRSACPSAGRTPGSCSATSSRTSRIEPSKKTLLGLYVSGPLGSTADRWPYKYLTVAQFQ